MDAKRLNPTYPGGKNVGVDFCREVESWSLQERRRDKEIRVRKKFIHGFRPIKSSLVRLREERPKLMWREKLPDSIIVKLKQNVNQGSSEDDCFSLKAINEIIIGNQMLPLKKRSRKSSEKRDRLDGKKKFDPIIKLKSYEEDEEKSWRKKLRHPFPFFHTSLQISIESLPTLVFDDFHEESCISDIVFLLRIGSLFQVLLGNNTSSWW